MTTFLFKYLEKYGKPASVLFSLVDFGEQRIEVVNRLLNQYSNKFDFNMINETLTKTVKNLTSEMTKQKEEYLMLFKQMQETFNEQLAELKEMKKQEEEKQKQYEIDNKKRIENFSSDINKIKNDFDEKINYSQDQFQQICKKQKEFIDDTTVKKYHQIILETITIGQFREFDDKLKDHFISELIINDQKKKEDYLYAKFIIDCISMPESYDYIRVIEIFRGKEKDRTKVKITSDKIENLYQKGQLNSCFTNCINLSNLFDDFQVEIEYQCNKFEQIMKIISDFKMKNDQIMKISININDKRYFEQKNKWNKIINACKIGKSIEVIPENSFCEFSNMSTFELSPDTSKIGSSSFKNCTSLAQIKIPEKVTSIGDFSFHNCSSLTEITIPTSVKSIGDHCFDGCSKLDRLTINPFYTKIQFNSFNNCPSLKHLTILTARDNKYKTNEHILISYNITDFFYRTNFLNSSELTSYINECLEIIFEIQYPSSDFSNVYQKVINLKQNNSKIKIGIFYTQMEITDKYFYKNKEINYLRLDSNVKETPNDGDDINDSSFGYCSSLIEVFIPSSVNKIGNYTFEQCKSLNKVIFEFPSSVTSIGKCAFVWCTSLTQISIPSSINSIKDGTFQSCTSLPQISLPQFLTSIDDCAFFQCSSLTQISIPSSVTFIGNEAFFGCSLLTQISIPSSVTSIGDYTFIGCSSLNKINFENPYSVTSIGKCAFKSCRSLAQISIPSFVTTIGDEAFSECCLLTQVSIPSSVTSIGNEAFNHCKSLQNINFENPSSLTSIGNYAFNSCSSLTQISIPSSVTSIGNSPFSYCSSLTQITIPSRINTSNLNINSNITINRI